MSAALLHPTGLRPTHQPGSLRAAALALAAHGLLIAALALGLNWRIRPQENVVAAEIWAAVPQVAAPAPVEPPTPRVEPPPAPKPVPAPTPQPVEVPAPPRDAQIAIEKAKREKKAALEHEAELKQAEKLKAERLQAEKLKADKERAEKDKAKEQEREKAERLKKEQLAQREKAQEERLAQQREANLARIRGLAGAEGAPTATGTAARDAAPSAAYAGRIKARIKPNIVLTSEVGGNPVAEVEVRCSPDGLIISRRIVKPSGDKTWDDTVLRAIDRTEMLPRDVDGRVPGTMTLVFPRRE